MKTHDQEATAVLSAFYDLSVSPTGFDFASFLSLAEIERRRRGLAHFQVVFVPAGGSGFWSNESYGADYKAWRLHHLLLPLLTLYPRCSGSAVCGSREEAEVLARRAGSHAFPEHYSVKHPPAEAYQWAYLVAALACGERLPAWQPPAAADAFVDQWLTPRVRGRKVITITLREAKYHEQHNSNLDAWSDFARSLDPNVYCPVFLRDTERALDGVPDQLQGFSLFQEPSFNVALRAALYLKSHLNMMSASGPMYLAWLHPRCATLVFKWPSFADFRASPMPLRALGFEPGHAPTFLSPVQRIVWQDDDGETIKKAFLEMEEALARSEPAPLDSHTPMDALAIARRLRRSGRTAAARQIYTKVQTSRTESIASAAAKAGLTLIAIEENSRSGRLSRLVGLLCPPRPEIPDPLFNPAAKQTGASGSLLEPDAGLDIAELCLTTGQYDRAQEICRTVLSQHPDHAEGLRLMGEIALRKGEIAEALLHLGRAAELDPWLALARFQYGVALVLDGRTKEAEAEFLACALDDPSHEAARQTLVALGSTHTLPEGFTYQDALDRRSAGTVGTIGELGFPIELPERRRGHVIIYFRGLFYAVPDTGYRIVVDWRTGRACRLVPRSAGLARAWNRHRQKWPPHPAIERISTATLYRRVEASNAPTASTLAELDRAIDSARRA